MEKPQILIIDDDSVSLQTAHRQLSELGYGATTASDGVSGNRLLHAEEYELVLLDLRLPDTDGLTLLKEWKARKLPVSVVMVSGQGTIPEAVEALKCGAVDFLVKPVDIRILEAVVNRTLTARRLERENVRLRELAKAEEVNFLGKSDIVQELLKSATRIAASDNPVLLEGETGTGKQVLARYIHQHSPRAGEPWVHVNCASIIQTLFESELFGHEKGAFTGAYARKAGKLELVGKGTLFLDEICELPVACQAKLLTAVEDRRFERVGGTTTLHFEGRIIAATNRNVEMEISEGNFRKDLFYRLNTFRLKLPALREHPDDIPIYIEHTSRLCSRKYQKTYSMPDEETLQQLKNYPWHGNVRELIHHVERIAVLADSNQIPKRLWLSCPMVEQAAASETGEIDLKAAIEAFRKQHVFRVLDACGGNQTEAAGRLGIGRTYLNRLLSEYRRQD